MPEQLAVRCACVNVQFGTYEAGVVVRLPWKDKRVTIDKCILGEIRKLWVVGIRTTCNCCGHNKIPAMVCVEEESAVKMEEMGYERLPNPSGEMNPDTFYIPLDA